MAKTKPKTGKPNPTWQHKDEKDRVRFKKGNPGGPGNPKMRETMKWRELFHSCVTTEDVQSVYAALRDQATAGEGWAVKEFLDRTIGTVKNTVDINARGITGVLLAPAVPDAEGWIREATRKGINGPGADDD